jgi:hypothetical protein
MSGSELSGELNETDIRQKPGCAGLFYCRRLCRQTFLSGPFDFQARSISDDAVILRGQWLALRQ